MNDNSKFLHKPTGIIFENRKQAAMIMGISRYRRALKKCEFIFNYQDQEVKAN